MYWAIKRKWAFCCKTFLFLQRDKKNKKVNGCRNLQVLKNEDSLFLSLVFSNANDQAQALWVVLSFSLRTEGAIAVLRIPPLKQAVVRQLGLTLQGDTVLMDIAGHSQELPSVPTRANLSPAQESHFSTAPFNTVCVFQRDKTFRQGI